MKQSRIHFMGIGGQGISAVAQMVLEAEQDNVTVTGCDMQASATTRAMERAGVPVQIGHSPSHLADVDRLVVVPAAIVLDASNPELLAARQRGIPMMTWQEMLGELMQQKCVLSVSGVHGKGTTTALLSLMLVDAGLDPTCEVGAVVPRFGANYRLGKSQYFVNEADEFYNNFWHYHPRLAIVTSIEFEHPEFFADYSAFLASFEHFVRGMNMDSDGDWPFPPTLILNADSPGCLELLSRLSDWPGRVVTYRVEGLSLSSTATPLSRLDSISAALKGGSINQKGREGGQPQGIAPTEVKQAVYKATFEPTFEAYDLQLEGETSFRVRSQVAEVFPADVQDIRIQLQLPGAHNVQNALAALAAASIAGIEPAVMVKTLEEFGGIRRRFEIRHQGPLSVNGQEMDIVLVDDYAHHPTAIATTLDAARKRYPSRRLIAVYQPHMFSRTQTFFEQFLSAFDGADVTIIADIFPARERDTGLISARELVQAMLQQPRYSQESGQVKHGGSVQETLQVLRTILRSGDLVLIMGAGDIYTLTEMLLQEG